jgi:hypothetical protein
MGSDDDRIECLARSDVVREWFASGAVRILRHQVETADVEKASRRARVGRAIASDGDLDCGRSG